MRVDVPEYNTFIDFPDNTPPAEIQRAMNENFPVKRPAPSPAEPESGGFVSDVSKAISERAGNISSPKPSAVRDFSPTFGAALNVAGQVGGLVGDVALAGLKKITPEPVKEAGGMIMKSLAGNPVVNAGVSAFKSLPAGVQQDVGNVANATMLLPAVQGARLVKPAAVEVANIGRDVANLVRPVTAETINKELASIVGKSIEKAIRPTVVGKRTAAKAKAYYDRATEAVKNIIGNRDNLVLTDAEGNAVAGELPKTLKQFSESIEQTKKSIFDQYHAMAMDAGEGGAVFDSTGILKKLDSVATDLKHNPQVRQYANDLKAEIEELHGQPPDIIEARIADLNNSLNGFYEGRVSKAKAKVDASVANQMREELDNMIMSASGPGYQDLKNTYGALKSIEKEVNHRAVVDARKNIKGLADFSDIFTGGEIIGGVLSMNPAMVARGATGYGIKKYIKWTNKADRIVGDMFANAEKTLGKTPTQPGMQSNLGKYATAGLENILQKEAPGTIPVEPRPNQARPTLAVGPVRSGVTVGEPYGPQPSRLIYPKKLPAGQGFELVDNPDVIDAQFTARPGKPTLQLPAGQQQPARLALPAGQGFVLVDQPVKTILRKGEPSYTAGQINPDLEVHNVSFKRYKFLRTKAQ